MFGLVILSKKEEVYLNSVTFMNFHKYITQQLSFPYVIHKWHYFNQPGITLDASNNEIYRLLIIPRSLCVVFEFRRHRI